MERNFRINPVGLKGNEINERMKQLMGVTPINESLSRSTVELTKIGPDGKAYGIVRENHEYYIKVSDKTSNLTVEDFKYIGGLQNKKSEAYPSYAKATKHLNLKFNSICESFDIVNTFNVFVDDNLLSEGAAKEATKHITDAKGKELGGKVKEEGGDNLAEKKVIDELEEVTLTEDELAIDAMLKESDEEDLDESAQGEVGLYAHEKHKEEKLKGNKDKVDANKNGKIDGEDFKLLKKGKTNENIDDQMSTDELMDKLENMSAKELLQMLGDAGRDLKNVIASKLSTGMDRARDYFDRQYPDVDEAEQFHDLTGDGDVTSADILKGRGVDLDEEMSLEEIQEAIADLKKKTLSEAKKYKLKLDKPASEAPIAPAPAPAEPTTEPADEAGFGDFGGNEMPAEEPMDDMSAEAPSNDMPDFEKEPFDAGVDANEESDPKKFIEQLSGKLGQSLRQYTKDQGQPDFELEKFAINSVISASHTAEMDEEDRNDIIKKIEKSGEDETQDFGDDNQAGADAGDDSFGGPDNGAGASDEFDFSSGDAPVQEGKFMLDKAKKLSIFAPEGSEEAKFKHINEDGEKRKYPACRPTPSACGTRGKGKKWGKKSTSEGLNISENFSIFNKNYLKMRLQETFNHEEPLVLPAEPKTKPKESPMIQPSRRNKPFLPERETQPDPKAEN